MSNQQFDEFRFSNIDRYGGGALPSCGRWGYAKSDLNQDCVTNLADFSVLAGDWLKCTYPGGENCGPCTDPLDCQSQAEPWFDPAAESWMDPCSTPDSDTLLLFHFNNSMVDEVTGLSAKMANYDGTYSVPPANIIYSTLYGVQYGTAVDQRQVTYPVVSGGPVWLDTRLDGWDDPNQIGNPAYHVWSDWPEFFEQGTAEAWISFTTGFPNEHLRQVLCWIGTGYSDGDPPSDGWNGWSYPYSGPVATFDKHQTAIGDLYVGNIPGNAPPYPGPETEISSFAPTEWEPSSAYWTQQDLGGSEHHLAFTWGPAGLYFFLDGYPLYADFNETGGIRNFQGEVFNIWSGMNKSYKDGALDYHRRDLVDEYRFSKVQRYPVTIECGFWGNRKADLDADCYVGLGDVSELAMKWLDCTDPDGAGCYVCIGDPANCQ